MTYRLRNRARVTTPVAAWMPQQFTGAFDALSTSPAGCYGLRRLRSSWAGSAIRVRRSSDNAIVDIGFTPTGALDQTALTGFIGANTGTVVYWYDQSGNNRHLQQTTNANQPRIVNAGTVDTKNGQPTIVFSGSQWLAYSTAAPMVSGTGEWTANTVAYLTTASGTQSVVDGDNNPSARLAQFLRLNATTVDTVAFNTTPTAYGASAGTVTGGTLLVASATRSTTTVTAYNNGTAGTGTSTAGTGATAAAPFAIGRSGTATPGQYLTGGVSEVAMFAAVLSTADRNALERGQGSFFGVTVA